MRRWPAALAALALAPLVPWTQQHVDRFGGGYRAQEEALYLWSGEQVRRLAPGFEGLAADIYWLRTVQYFGGERLFAANKRFELLHPLIDITTTLDPRLEIAYRYGAIFLCEPPPVGAGRPREGVAVLEKGVRNQPTSWSLRWYYGLFHFLFLGDARRAAQILHEAARLPGAPFWLDLLAADTLGYGGERARARRMWQQMYEQAELGVIKNNARRRLRVYDSLDEADRLTALVARFSQRTGRHPHALDELRAAGLANGPFKDAGGVPFIYDEKTGKVGISHESPMWIPHPPRSLEEQ